MLKYLNTPKSLSHWLMATLILGAVHLCSSAVLINEFLAANDQVNADPQGDYDDWVELYNTGPDSVDLSGMYLTDDLQNPTWTFPSGTQLAAGGYLLIWADKDLANNPDGLHADFKLSSAGEAIGLFESDGVTLVDSITFGAQLDDVSYGRYPDGNSMLYSMDDPTPAGANTAAMSEAVYFSKLGGVMTNAFVLKLSTPSDQAEIRYTTNGSVPTETSPLYDNINGIYVDNSESRRIRARSYESGRRPGPVRTEGYLAASVELQAFDSNVPIVIIETFNQILEGTSFSGPSLVKADPIATYATFFDIDEASGRIGTLSQPNYAGRAGVNIRGQSTSEFPKKPYKLETWDEANEDMDVSLLGLPAESDWVLRNPHSDKTFMRDALVFELSNAMDHYSPGAKFIEVFVNEDGGQIGGPGSSDYMGVYLLIEKIKRSEGRVDIEKLEASDVAEPDITGGYIIRHDKNRPEDEFSTWAGRWFYVEPSSDEITTPQKNYIKNYIEEFEAALQGTNFADPTNGYAKYIDVESFIDHDLISEMTKEVDSYVFSTYVTKDRNGKLKMSPEWDYNWSLGNNDYTAFGLPEQHHTTGWNNRVLGLWEYRWHARLMDDPEYLMRYTDRWFHLRETALSDVAVAESIDANFQMLNAEAAGRNFSRWDILNSWVGFAWSFPGPNFYYGGNPNIPCNATDHTYEMQVEWLKNWLTGTGTPSGACAAEAYAPQYSDRLGWMDNNLQSRTGFSLPPRFRHNGALANAGAVVASNDTLNIISDSGLIYYTLDGSDPREAFTGNILGTAYSTTTTTNSTLIASSAACTATIPTSSTDATDWKATGFDDSAWLSGTSAVGYEFSPGATDYSSLIGLDVSGMYNNSESVYIRVPFTVSGAGDITDLQLNMKYDDAFVAYLNGVEVARSAYVPANLSWNSGATSYHEDSLAMTYQNFDVTAYRANLQDGANVLAIHGLNSGAGSSDLIFAPQLLATSTATQVGNSENGITLNKTYDVRARSKDGSTWSALNQAVFANDQVKDSLRITEIMYNPDSSDGEFIELQNVGTTSIDLYLCKLTDGVEFIFPDIQLGPGEFVLVVENQLEFEDIYGAGYTIAGEFSNSSGLSNGGEEIVLRDAGGREIHDFDYKDWYPVTDGRGFSLCAVDPLAANLDLWDQRAGWEVSQSYGGNPGAPHAAGNLAYGAIVINEILSHSDASSGDWVELYNTTNTSIDVSSWFLSDDADALKKYQIANGTIIPAGGYLVFTQNNNFGVGANDTGNLSGFGLSELGETLFLSSGANGNLSGGYSISQSFGATLNGVTLGRYIKSYATSYEADFVTMSSPSMGSYNTGPLIPKVVIKEILYNSVGGQDEVAEYIELFNRSSETMYLYDTANPANTWKFIKGIEYTFPQGVSIPSGGHLIVVRTDPDIFRHLHNIPASHPVYGPYQNALGNNGDDIELAMPGSPEVSSVPYVTLEKVAFTDGSNDAWPTAPDTYSGYSLQREQAEAYGNDVINWAAAFATPYTPDVRMISIQRSNDALSLHWIGAGGLQSTTQLPGPWSDETSISSPHSLETNQGGQKFFRLGE